MSILRVCNLRFGYPGGRDNVFEGIEFAIDSDDKVGLIGPNGSGKTTLLKILAGDLKADSGEIVTPRGGIRFGYMPQDVSSGSQLPVIDEVKSALPELLSIESRMRELEGRMPTVRGEALDDTMREYGALQLEFDSKGGYSLGRRAEAILERFGLGGETLKIPVCHLSSGQKNRVALAKLLLLEPDVLLLDEPTNHLDIRAIEWLEGYLKGYKGAVIMVSHDRHFLDAVIDFILELDRKRIVRYSGNYSFYARERDLKRAHIWKDYEERVEEAERLRQLVRNMKERARRISRSGKGTPRDRDKYSYRWHQQLSAGVARRAKVLEGRIARLGEMDRPYKPKRVKLTFPNLKRSGDVVLEVRGVSKSFGGRSILWDVDFTIVRGERVALLGDNGSGKTTLIKLILGEVPPDEGEVRIGAGVSIGYCGQEHEDVSTDHTVLQEIEAIGGLDGSWARTVLAVLHIGEDKISSRVSDMSLGQRSKVSVAKLLLGGANFLLLDEPTNHLDLTYLEALEGVLAEYPGTILFVSHDRRFIEGLATRILSIEGGTVKDYPGGYRYYLERRDPDSSP
ncbi:MAG: ribosomal protection-like ABC-F family protein [bacterium]